jgi:hypothetical protein
MSAVLCCLLFAVVVPGLAVASAGDVRYVAPTKQGTGGGQTENDAALYTAPDFWQRVQSSLARGPVSVRFSGGEYVGGALKLAGIGHPEHRLVIQGHPEGGTVFRILPEEGQRPSTGLYISQGSQNITIRDLHFTGRGKVGYITHVEGSRNILFASCSWHDLPHITFGATGSAPGMTVTPENTSLTDTHHITYKSCTFKRVGTRGGAHMIYNAYGPRHVYVTDCYFEDCSGDYVRFRDLSDYCVVNGSTFKSTGTYPPGKPVQRPFITMPLFSDANPGDEWFGTHFLISGNTFIYQQPSGMAGRTGPAVIRFYHKGYDPPGRNHLLTEEEGAILGGRDRRAAKALLRRNCGIDADQVRVFANKYTGTAGGVTYNSRAAYGATSRGWKKTADIFDLLNHDAISLEDWIASMGD